jgi:hypothetical protein
MASPLTRTLRAYAADARSAFSAAPVEVALGVLLAVALSGEVRGGAARRPQRVVVAVGAAGCGRDDAAGADGCAPPE